MGGFGRWSSRRRPRTAGSSTSGMPPSWSSWTVSASSPTRSCAAASCTCAGASPSPPSRCRIWRPSSSRTSTTTISTCRRSDRWARNVPVIVPRGARRAVWGFSDVRELRVGEEIRLGEVTVRAVPAEHKSARLPLFPSPALGYVISGSRTVYFAGDTDLFAGMAGLADNLDVALVPVAGWGPKVGPGHLDPARAAHAVQLLQPRIAVPIHWGTLSTLRAARVGRAAARVRASDGRAGAARWTCASSSPASRSISRRRCRRRPAAPGSCARSKTLAQP